MESAIDKSVVVFDVLPANLRQSHYYFETMTFCASLALNFALIALLLTERSRELREYSRVLLVNCVVDVVFALVAFPIQMEIEPVDNRQIAIVNGRLASALAIRWQYWAVFVWTASFSASLAVIPLVFVFRYFIIVRQRIMSNWQIFAFVASAIVFAVHQGAGWALAVAVGDEDRATVCASTMNYTIWTRERTDNCLPTTRNSGIDLYAAGVATVVNVLLYATMIYSTVTVMRTMKKTRGQMSTKTSKLQRQMNRMFIIQMCLPLFTAMLPLALIVTFPYFLNIYVPGIGILLTMAFTAIPLMSPLTTILFVSNFRRKIFRPLRQILPRKMDSFFNSTASQIRSVNNTQTGRQSSVIRMANPILI